MDRIHLRLSAADGESWEEQVSSITLPAANGLLGVLANHAPMLCALTAGTVSCRSEDGRSWRFAVSSGIASVKDNRVTLLLDSFEQLAEQAART